MIKQLNPCSSLAFSLGLFSNKLVSYNEGERYFVPPKLNPSQIQTTSIFEWLGIQQELESLLNEINSICRFCGSNCEIGYELDDQYRYFTGVLKSNKNFTRNDYLRDLSEFKVSTIFVDGIGFISTEEARAFCAIEELLPEEHFAYVLERYGKSKFLRFNDRSNVSLFKINELNIERSTLQKSRKCVQCAFIDKEYNFMNLAFDSCCYNESKSSKFLKVFKEISVDRGLRLDEYSSAELYELALLKKNIFDECYDLKSSYYKTNKLNSRLSILLPEVVSSNDLVTEIKLEYLNDIESNSSGIVKLKTTPSLSELEIFKNKFKENNIYIFDPILSELNREKPRGNTILEYLGLDKILSALFAKSPIAKIRGYKEKDFTSTKVTKSDDDSLRFFREEIDDIRVNGYSLNDIYKMKIEFFYTQFSSLLGKNKKQIQLLSKSEFKSYVLSMSLEELAYQEIALIKFVRTLNFIKKGNIVLFLNCKFLSEKEVSGQIFRDFLNNLVQQKYLLVY